MYGWSSSRRTPGTADSDNPTAKVTERRREEDLAFMAMLKTAPLGDLEALEIVLVAHAERMKKPHGWRIVAVQRRIKKLREVER